MNKDANYENTPLRQTKENGMATTALVLGLIAFVLGTLPVFGWFMFPVAVLAIIFGAIALQKKQGRTNAIAGISLGVGWGLWKIGFYAVVIVLSAVS